MLTKLEEKNLIKAVLKGYKHLNLLNKEHKFSDLAIATNINSPYGHVRNFYIKATCIAYSKIKYEIKQIGSYKYPVFILEDGNTFTLHYKNEINKILPKYLSNIISKNDIYLPLFHNEINYKQHYVLFYSGQGELENLNLNECFIGIDNKIITNKIKDIKIDQDILLEQEIQIPNPSFSLKQDIIEKERIEINKAMDILSSSYSKIASYE